MPARAFDPSCARPVLVFGSDANAFLGTVRSLGQLGLVVHTVGCGPEHPARASRHIAQAHDIPRYRDDQQGWLAGVRDLIAEHDYSLLVPTSDASLGQLAAHADELGRDRLAIADVQVLDQFADKWVTRTLAQGLEIPVAPGEIVSDRTALSSVAARLGLPLILKHRRSYDLGSQVQKSAVTLLRDLDAVEEVDFAGGDLFAEGFVDGCDVGIAVLSQHGRIVMAFQYRALRQSNPTGPSSSRVSEAVDPALLDSVRRLMEHTRYHGIAMFDFRDPGNAAPVLIEINARLWGSLQLATRSGVDFPAALYRMAIAGEAPPSPPPYRTGVSCRTVWGEYEALSLAAEAARGRERLTVIPQVLEFLAALARGHAFDSYAPDDPEPFRAERAEVMRRLTGYAAKSFGREPSPDPQERVSPCA